MNKSLVLVTLPFCIVGCYIMLNLCWDYFKQGEWTIFIIYFLWCVCVDCPWHNCTNSYNF